MEHDIVYEQIAYYRARAEEYDESIYQVGCYASPGESNEGLGELEVALHTLRTLGPVEHILELACGTGIWTKELLKICHTVRTLTAIDASPEMLHINSRKVADLRVRYHLADLFTWEPGADQHYDLVFFAFWLSHVPPEHLDTFLTKVQRSVRSGGQLFIVDQYAPMQEDLLCVHDDIYSKRPLHDGREFTIVKVFYDLTALKDKLTQLGFDASVQKIGDYFFTLSGTL
jgi:ubiquinone/menaquinone biosynthesis C-methylase UbiE